MLSIRGFCLKIIKMSKQNQEKFKRGKIECHEQRGVSRKGPIVQSGAAVHGKHGWNLLVWVLKCLCGCSEWQVTGKLFP